MNQGWFRFIASTKIIELIQKERIDFRIEKKETSKNSISDLEVLNLKNKVISITKNHYINTFIDIFNDLEEIKIDNTKSVNNRIKNYSKDVSSTNSLDKLEENISLFKHTENVINYSILCTHDRPDAIKAIVILLSLSHDFGKSKRILDDVIKNNSNIYSNTRHDIVSSYYLRKILLKNKEIDNLENNHIQFLCQVLENQHSEKSINNDIVELFYKADSLAREYELSYIKELEVGTKI